MKYKKLVTLAVFAFLSSGAWASEPPRFDTSSEEASRASNRAVAQQLPAERRELLAASVIKLGMVEGAQPYTLPNGTQTVGIPPERIRAILHGKTAEEIIALAEKTPSSVKSVEFRNSK